MFEDTRRDQRESGVVASYATSDVEGKPRTKRASVESRMKRYWARAHVTTESSAIALYSGFNQGHYMEVPIPTRLGKLL